MLSVTAPLIIEATATHTASLIFLHGLGDSGLGWAPVARDFARQFPFMKFILPHAPIRPITINSGFSMPAWYDIYTLSETDDREDEAGIQQASQIVVKLVDAERQAGISNDRIFIGGFSQGGATSIFTALTQPQLKLAGIIALSAYVPCRRHFKENSPGPLTNRLFMGHGTDDMVIQYRWHQHSVQFLRSLGGLPITVRKYEGMQHSSCEEELADIADFIKERLASNHDEL